jgi:lysophospholipase L1-like esterase
MKINTFIFIIILSFLIPQVQGQVNSGLSILTIGDSNGAAPDGWPEQLKKLLPGTLIINKSVSGNTIGFDNLGRESLNTVRNIHSYLDQAYEQTDELDFILICLGTNDTKTIFIDRQKEVPENMSNIFTQIRTYMTDKNKKMPDICYITPPPMDESKTDKEKYGGGDRRIRKNNKAIKKIAGGYRIDFLDTYKKLKEDFAGKTADGVHLNGEAQMETASIIADYIKRSR